MTNKWHPPTPDRWQPPMPPFRDPDWSVPLLFAFVVGASVLFAWLFVPAAFNPTVDGETDVANQKLRSPGLTAALADDANHEKVPVCVMLGQRMHECASTEAADAGVGLCAWVELAVVQAIENAALERAMRINRASGHDVEVEEVK